MSQYAIEYMDGRVDDIVADCDAEAVRIALARLGDDAVSADQWDSDGTNDDGQPMERMLIWASEEDSTNDAGAKAVAQVTVVR